MQVLCIVTAQGRGRSSTMQLVKIEMHFVKGCCTATNMALTSFKQKEFPRVHYSDNFRENLITLIPEK